MEGLLAVLVLPPALIAAPLLLARIERRLFEGRRPPHSADVPLGPPLPRPSGEQPVLQPKA